MPTAKICKFRPRTELRDLCAPSREDDEKLLRVIAAYEDNGGTVTFPGEGSEAAEGKGPDVLASAPQPYVSPYLLKPLRSEAEVRAARSPRIPQAKGLAQCVAECTGIDKAFRALIGGA